MNTKEIMKKYPKSYEALVKFNKVYLTKALEIMAGSFMEEFPVEEVTNEQAEMSVIGIIETMPRTLYDFFDENQLFIQVMPNNGDFFNWNIQTKDGSFQVDDPFPNRPITEENAFLGAFEMLEGKL